MGTFRRAMLNEKLDRSKQERRTLLTRMGLTALALKWQTSSLLHALDSSGSLTDEVKGPESQEKESCD